MTASRFSALSHLECPRCGSRHDAGTQQGLCGCGSPLLARYDLGRVAATVRPAELGWITGDLPRLVAVQASGCAPIVAAFEAGAPASDPWPDARTVAFGLTVPKALGDFLVLHALRATGGTAVAVDDEELLADQRLTARLEGCFICPEGAACVSAIRRLREAGWLSGSRSRCSTPAPA